MLKRLLIIALLLVSPVRRIDAANVQADTNFPISNPGSVFDASHAGNSYTLGSGSTFDNPGAGGYDVRDICGGTFGTYAPETSAVVFADNQARGTIQTVEVALPSAVSLKSYHLWLAEDNGNNGHRSARQFQLFAGSTLVDTANILDSTGSQSYSGVYGSTGIQVSNTLSAPSASSYPGVRPEPGQRRCQWFARG